MHTAAQRVHRLWNFPPSSRTHVIISYCDERRESEVFYFHFFFCLGEKNVARDDRGWRFENSRTGSFLKKIVVIEGAVAV